MPQLQGGSALKTVDLLAVLADFPFSRQRLGLDTGGKNCAQ